MVSAPVNMLKSNTANPVDSSEPFVPDPTANFFPSGDTSRDCCEVLNGHNVSEWNAKPLAVRLEIVM
ncbi:hypothetical protein D3C73_1628930 [compost metagenome]